MAATENIAELYKTLLSTEEDGKEIEYSGDLIEELFPQLNVGKFYDEEFGTDLFEMATAFEKIAKQHNIQGSDDVIEDDVNDDAENSANAYPRSFFVSKDLFYFVEEILENSKVKLSRSQLGTLCAAIITIGRDYFNILNENTHMKEVHGAYFDNEKEYAYKKQLAKETKNFLTFINNYNKGYTADALYTNDPEFHTSEKDIEKIVIHYGNGINSKKVEMPEEWFNLYIVCFNYFMNRKAKHNVAEDFYKYQLEIATDFLDKYTKRQDAKIIFKRQHAINFENLLKKFSVESSTARYDLIGQIYAKLRIIETVRKSDKVDPVKTYAGSVRKLIDRTKK